METTKSNHETLNEGAKVIEKLFNNTNSAMTEMFKKQMDLTTSFYSNLFNAGLAGNNVWNQNSFSNMFAGMGMTKGFTNPFASFTTNNTQNPFVEQMEKTMKQVMEFNQNMISVFTNGINGNDTNLEAIGEEYKETINARLEASKKIMNSVSEAFNKQIESSIEMNKKTIEEISDQFNKVMKQNQKLWADMLNIYQAPLQSEEKKKTDPIVYETKKRDGALVNEFKDHKR